MLQRKMDCVKQELLKAKVSKFILTVYSRGCMPKDLTLREDYILEVFIGENIEIPEG